jgi:hypothetical protein
VQAVPARRPRPALPAPPDLRDWLPNGHLAWFILDVVDQLDLDPFYRLERRCQEDIAFRALAARSRTRRSC